MFVVSMMFFKVVSSQMRFSHPNLRVSDLLQVRLRSDRSPSQFYLALVPGMRLVGSSTK